MREATTISDGRDPAFDAEVSAMVADYQRQLEKERRAWNKENLNLARLCIQRLPSLQLNGAYRIGTERLIVYERLALDVVNGARLRRP